MANDDIELPNRGYNTEDIRAQRDPGAPPPRRSHWRRWLLLTLLAVIAIPLVAFGLWSWIALSYTYSSGERSGYVQKLSKKGWLCKSWEGELAMANLPGSMPQLFNFSVRDDQVAEQINRTMGDRVTVHYEQHRGVPTSCFGETQYFVTSVTPYGTPGATPAPMPVPPGTPAAPGTGNR